MAAIGDLVDADADQAGETVLVEVIGDHARDDRPDRVPADPQQPSDRRERHLLGQPRDHVFEVARVVRARARPRDRLQPHAAVAAAQPAQLALDDAAARAEVQVPPALDAPIVDLQVAAGLPAARADRRRRRSRTVTITPSPPKLTSTTDAPGKRSSRLNAVLTRTSLSFASR